MRDGLYRMVYAGFQTSAVGLFALRGGAFSGIGETGAEYRGTYQFEPARNLYVFAGQVAFPPHVQLVTGGSAPANGLDIRFRGETRRPDPSARFSLDFAGRAVDVAMTYIAPLPGDTGAQVAAAT